MLVLSRQRDESIIIGEDIVITIVDIRGEKVRLGISAPPHVPVHRKEVYEAIKREKLASGDKSDSTKVQSLAHRKTDTPPTTP
ncbi:MAG: carbon storage regulator CsrA [Planctomycetota bacterium]|jgi:carbon storage regulator